MMAEPRFPDGFVWGAATASYQIEGAVHEDGRSESIWDRFSHTPGNAANGDTGDVACDHYHRSREDIAIMRELGIKAYRFSIAWPRVIPGGSGSVNEKGLDFYDGLIDALLEAGIEPWVTLYHWDLPQTLQDAGGWTNRATVDAFAEFTEAVTARLGDRVKHWITINEPWCASFLSYELGIHAPGLKDLSAAITASHLLLLAHGVAASIIRRNVPAAKVGIALNPTSVYPDSKSAEDAAAATRQDGYINRWFLDPLYGRGYPQDTFDLFGSAAPAIAAGDLEIISAPTDFLAVNFYNPTYIADDPSSLPLRVKAIDRPAFEHTAMGWMVEPRGLRDLLVRLHDDYTPGPIFITENGAAYDDPVPFDGRVADPRRAAYYESHFRAVLDAIDSGAPVVGYFAWSLLDNFEWAEGYTKRFGITYVDYDTQVRTIKESGRRYGRVIAANQIVD